MIYLWDEQQRATNLARYRLDFRDAHTALHAAHAWKFRNRDAQMAVARVCNGVAVFVRAALSPDGEAVTILEFRPAYRWEAVIADKWKRQDRKKLAKPASKTASKAASKRKLNPAAKAAGDRAAQSSQLASDKAAKAASKRKLGRPAKAAGARAAQFSLRVPGSVLKRWQHAGKGWQTRMAQRLATLECEHQPTSALDLAFLPTTRRKRGQVEPSDSKTPICLRLPPDVLARWKATGPGWQTCMVARLAAG